MVEQISVKVTKALESGIHKINIQLRPAHMGRVEVKLEMANDNRLSVMVITDNRETLETLKNDSRDLQRALLDAGLNTDSGDLNFSLRGEEQQAQDDKGSSGRPLTGDEDIAELEEMIIEEAIIASDGRVLTNGRIDVRA
jgi:flagellar hook-length control protein FliK